MKKYIKIYVILFKNWNKVFELSYQTGPICPTFIGFMLCPYGFISFDAYIMVVYLMIVGFIPMWERKNILI